VWLLQDLSKDFNLGSKLTCFFHTLTCRHGQSEFNIGGRLGGDSSISEAGDRYANLLPAALLSRLPPVRALETRHVETVKAETKEKLCARALACSIVHIFSHAHV